MKVLQTRGAPRYKRAEGITSYLLASSKTSGAEQMTTSCVEIQPGGKQRVHSHRPEQIYFILGGHGRMTVGQETEEVGVGVCVFIPSGVPHGLENTGSELLRYFSAAAPAFAPDDLDEWWPLPSEADEAEVS